VRGYGFVDFISGSPTPGESARADVQGAGSKALSRDDAFSGSGYRDLGQNDLRRVYWIRAACRT
jgi:hypothetical protein